MKKSASPFQLYFFLSFFFLAWPFGSACIAFMFLLNGQYKREMIFFIALFFGLFGYTFMPESNMDILRHYAVYEDLHFIDNISDFAMFEFMAEKTDFLLDCIYWLISKVGLPYQAIGFLGAFFFYYMLIKIADRWITILHVKNYKLGLILLLGSLLSITPVYEFSGMRNGNAILLFLYIITDPKQRKGFKLVFSLLCTCLIHFSMYPVVFLYSFSIYSKRKMILLLSLTLIIGFFFFIPVMQLIMHGLESFGGVGRAMSTKIDDYLFAGKNESALYVGSVLRFILVCGLLPLIFILWFKNDKGRIICNPVFLRLHYFLMPFMAYLIFSINSYILSRNLMLFKYLAILYLVSVIYKPLISVLLRRVLLITYLLIFCIGIPSVILGKEYRAINSALFSSNLISLLQIQIPLEGYEYK